MTTKELLIAARARIAQRERWTQGSYAQDADGEECSSIDEDARRWCATGALLRETPKYGHELFYTAKQALTDLGGHSLSYLNDSFDHAGILELFDLAIAAQPTQE